MVYNTVMMKKGLLIVNAFLKTEQVKETYDMLLAAAGRAGIDLTLMTNAQFFVDLESGMAVTEHEDDLQDISFILFWNKDVFLARALERMGYRLFNCADAIEACDSKALTFERLKGVCRVPKTFKIPMTFNTVGYDDLSFESFLEQKLGYPYVIKECLGSYGGQVYLADSRKKARKILKSIEGKDCIAQEFISESSGCDLRAYVVGNRVAAAMIRRNPDDFRSNIANGGSAKACSVTKEQEDLAVTAARALGLDFAGVDILFCEGGEPVLCEVNSNAQFRALRDATGIDVSDEIFRYIAETV